MVASLSIKGSDVTKSQRSWHDLELDGCLIDAIINRLAWHRPTLIQSNAIRECKSTDVIIIGRPGCGKTAAFILPILNSLIEKLTLKDSQENDPKIYAIIFEPSRDLCLQISSILDIIIKYLQPNINIKLCDTSRLNNEEISDHLSLMPHIVVSTPSKLFSILSNGFLQLDTLKFITFDEADLILSFGYKNDIMSLIQHFPKNRRTILTTATFHDSINHMKPLLLKKPTTIKLKDSDLELDENLLHYKIECIKDDKNAILFALFKLHLLTDKTIIFVNTVNQSYRIKIFLEQFGINASVLNPELPLNSRFLTIKKFNAGQFNILISSDFTLDEMNKISTIRNKEINDVNYNIDKEFNISRGIDFVNVKNVLNYDCPQSITSYIHRAGRTTRMNQQGIVITLLTTDTKDFNQNEQLFNDIYEVTDQKIRNFAFKIDQIEALKYRCSDIMNKITKQVIKNYRIQEIKQQLLTSTKLQDYFAKNPTDQYLLQKSTKKNIITKQPHLNYLPEYLIPNLSEKFNTNPLTSKINHKNKNLIPTNNLNKDQKSSNKITKIYNTDVLKMAKKAKRSKKLTKETKKKPSLAKIKKSDIL